MSPIALINILLFKIVLNIDERLINFDNMNLKKVAGFLELIVFCVSANVTKVNANINTQTPTTTPFPILENPKSSVVNLTTETFNREVANSSHFVMFFDPT